METKNPNRGSDQASRVLLVCVCVWWQAKSRVQFAKSVQDGELGDGKRPRDAAWPVESQQPATKARRMVHRVVKKKVPDSSTFQRAQQLEEVGAGLVEREREREGGGTEHWGSRACACAARSVAGLALDIGISDTGQLYKGAKAVGPVCQLRDRTSRRGQGQREGRRRGSERSKRGD